MRKLLAAAVMMFSVVAFADPVTMVNPRPVPNSNYEISNGSDGNLYCKNCGGKSGWNIMEGFEPLDDVSSRIVGAGWDTAIYWESMGSSCYYGSWIAINLKTGKSVSMGPNIEVDPEVCQSEPDEVNFEITPKGWVMEVAGKTYKGNI